MDDLFQRKILDEIKAAYHKNYVAFTDFCDLNEQNIIHSLPGSALHGVRVFFFGGCSTAERQMAAFVPDAFSYAGNQAEMPDFPISVIRIRPDSVRFAEKLTHRDYLGAVMSTGLTRSVFGDLIVNENEAYLFVKKQMAEFAAGEIRSVKHTAVTAVVVEEADESLFTRKYEEITAGVASERLDAMISSAFKLSRGKAQSAVEGGLVFVNGRQVLSNSFCPKENDILTLRGTGRVQYRGILKETKKGRLMVGLSKFI